MSYKIAVIGTVGLPAQYGGWETLTEQLVRNLPDDCELTVYCSAPHYPERPAFFERARLVYIKLKANGIQSIPYDVLSMLHAYRQHDLMLVLGVSGCIALPFMRLLTRKPIVVNIDGYEWKRAKWSKPARWFLRLSEAVAVRFAHAVITDNKVLQEYVKDEYGKHSTLIAYGGNQAKAIEPTAEAREAYPFLNAPYAFTVCRIEPENNIHVILEAFADTNMTLVIIGNWNHSDYGVQLRKRYAANANIHLLDPIYEVERLSPLRSGASVYLHGHSAGGTNPSLVEAMWLGLPVVAFDVSFNRATTEEQALYFADSGSLRQHVTALLEGTEARAALAERMHEIANRRYRWSVVADQYRSVFTSLLDSAGRR
ncbi:glycosyl transferase [Pseudomonas alkylphenolica]|uniref:Glycosyl transferase n=1 Tax=Pseudomonas alkylphenolica TaxID=237609 RepID=A0A443ZGD8_9PSED|nr:DUF1972 domain-containing protein [Pseudomonas alkylphenolica]RWU17774.1 glycosyl transferase [Pseudomonas alkylphenolica]